VLVLQITAVTGDEHERFMRLVAPRLHRCERVPEVAFFCLEEGGHGGNAYPGTKSRRMQDLARGTRELQYERLAIWDFDGSVEAMNATLTIDDAGRINLPQALKEVFGVKPGIQLRAEVTANRIEIVKDIEVVKVTSRSPSGRLILAPTGVAMNTAKAVREERDELANRALRR
jgi:bifunctional DNA-binding transcriptional regulator/antitoxin component of YhaV-PrlF toxin-antitoxin module